MLEYAFSMARNMLRLTSVGLLLFVFSLSSACDKANETNCIDASCTENALKISCGNGSIISQLNISSTDLGCGVGGNRCSGETSDMLVSQMSCYWKPNCTLRRPGQSPRHIFIKSDKYRCFGRFARHLKVDGYRCFPNTTKDTILDVMDCSGDNNNCNLLKQRGGLLRSHVHYPSMFVTPNPRKCCTSFIIDKNFPYLVLTFQDIDLGDGDSLQLTGNYRDSKQPPIVRDLTNTRSGQTIRETLNLVIEAEITFKGGDFSNGGRGFVLCFQFVAENENVPDACDAVTTKGNPPERVVVPERPEIFPVFPGLYPPIGADTTQKEKGTTTEKPKRRRKSCKKDKNKDKSKCRGKKNRKPRKKRKRCKKDKKCRSKKGNRKGKKKKPTGSDP